MKKEFIMPKNFQKYFIAIVPEGKVQEKATDLKLQLKEKFEENFQDIFKFKI